MSIQIVKIKFLMSLAVMFLIYEANIRIFTDLQYLFKYWAVVLIFKLILQVNIIYIV